MGSTVSEEIHSLVLVATPLNAITTSGKSFQWGKGQQKDFEELKKKISQAPVMALPNLQWPSEVETYASGYVMGVVFMQGGRHVWHYFEVFHGVVLNCPTYDKELYSMVQAMKK